MMKTVIRTAVCAALLPLVGFIASTRSAQNAVTKPTPKAATSSASNAEVQRGKYLVEEVAKCSECHTARNAQNQLDPARWLQGAPIWITPVKSTPSWADLAPAIAGFPYTDADAVNILEKGIGANGEAIRPPMHIYHLKHEDRVAIVAYLRSLPSAPQ
jgi:mono/diheme cytochrome c family protein